MRTLPQTLRMNSWRAGVAIVSPGDATTDTRVSAATVILIQLHAYICLYTVSFS
jgi:hypothetical protein